MICRKQRILGAALAAVLGVAPWASAAEPSATENLKAQIDALQAKVEQLEKKQITTEQIDASVDRVFNDANNRSQLMGAEGFTAGYSNGKFLIQSADGNFVMNPYLQMQFREVASMRHDAQNNRSDDLQNGFELRRMKFGFRGNVFTPDLTYHFLWATNRTSATTTPTITVAGAPGATASSSAVGLSNGGVPVLEEAWARYKFNDDWAVKFGQLKDPFSHEGLNSSTKLMSAERSYMTDVFAFGDNFVQGVEVDYAEKKDLRVMAAFHDGLGQSNTDFRDQPTNGANYGGAARVEYKALGDWKAYEDFTAIGTQTDLLVFGAAVDYTEGNWVPGNDSSTVLLVADAQYESPTGLSVFAQAYGRIQNSPRPFTSNGVTVSDTNDWAAMLQVAYAIDKRWEIFGRYEFIEFDGKNPLLYTSGTRVRSTDTHAITAGVNYYWYGQAAKFTLDAVWLPKGAPVAATGGDILQSNNTQDELVIRGQFQLLI